MIIKSIKLENIRSYAYQEIEFPNGSVLLSGDIGSGKSTILSAIEFALFGIKRGDLSGSALLRHGKKEGSVELRIDIDNKDIIIKRTLKRGKDDIKQETGYIIKDDLKKEATAVELKSMVLELLGFPQELVTKGKDLVYRYTVYTPQEQMKEILIADPEVRLDILRRVFGIDKYKRIRENALIISRFLREKIRLYEGQTQDLDEKESRKKEYASQLIILEDKSKSILPELDILKQDLNIKKKSILSIESKIQELSKLKKDLSISETSSKYSQEQEKKDISQIVQLEKEIDSIKKEINEKDDVNKTLIRDHIKKNQEKIIEIESIILNLARKTAFHEAIIKSSEELKNKISMINKCPTCLQDVNSEHKLKITEAEIKKIDESKSEIKNSINKRRDYENELKGLKETQETLRKKEIEISVAEVKKISISEKTRNIENLKKEIDIINKKQIELKEIIEKTKNEIDLLKDIEQNYSDAKKDYDTILQKERQKEIENAQILREKETISKIIISLESEIQQKQSVKKQMSELKEKDNWLAKHFVNVVTTIEKHVMQTVHYEFNELFKEWFAVLIEDESLTARLDDAFTPIIQQNGYETEFINLSGGERTSLALSYRLSLNKVINNLISTIKVKDIIILDEPTDGFSTEQLDRVKIVLDDLNLRQIILVSHESKIEGFVDNVLKVIKEDHNSKVIS